MAVGVCEAHIEFLVGLEISTKHVRDDEGVVVFPVEDIGEEDVFGAVGVISAPGAGPGRDGDVGAGHEAGGGRSIAGRHLAGGELEASVGWGGQSAGAGAQDGEHGDCGEWEIHGEFWKG